MGRAVQRVIADYYVPLGVVALGVYAAQQLPGAARGGGHTFRGAPPEE